MYDSHLILKLQELQVQCEAQVLLFLLDYVDSTQLEPVVAAQLFQCVSHVPVHCSPMIHAASLLCV